MSKQPHIPVMLNEVLETLQPQKGATYIDGTFGAGGYTKAILNKANCNVIAIDRDPTAIENGHFLVKEYDPRLTLIQGRFGDVETLINEKVDGFVLDIGVSSMQIDQAERGFSFMRDGPLDMRMGGGMSAAELIDESTEEELANLIYRYGEERQSRRIAKAIKNKMAEKPIQTTLELATLIEETIPRKWGDKIHPATRTFQALRVAVNDELGELERALEASVKILKPNGRLVVVTFHSLEDRIVKNFLKDHTSPQKAVNKYASESPEKDNHPFRLIQRKVLKASREEAIINSRARSAKLRSAIRTEVDS